MIEHQENNDFLIPGSIEQATSYKKAIEIIPENECAEGVNFLIQTFQKFFPDSSKISLIPILEGGRVIGECLAEKSGIEPNMMQMKFYPKEKNEQKLDMPVCIVTPNIERIINTGTVVFAEAVIESQKTILAAMQEINKHVDQHATDHNTHYQYPNYYTFALVSKINGNPSVPNLVRAFSVDENIWVHGMGCDDEGEGREKPDIWGRLSPFAKKIPAPPYFTRFFSI